MNCAASWAVGLSTDPFLFVSRFATGPSGGVASAESSWIAVVRTSSALSLSAMLTISLMADLVRSSPVEPLHIRVLAIPFFFLKKKKKKKKKERERETGPP